MPSHLRTEGPARTVETMSVEHLQPTQTAPPSPVILLVEDDLRVRTLLSQVLDTAGFGLLACSDPAEALAAARTVPRIDVLVTDVGLPGMCGSELAERLQETHPGLEMLFMSGLASPEDLRHRFGDDEERFMQKPFRPSEFVAKVIHLAARNRLEEPERSILRTG